MQGRVEIMIFRHHRHHRHQKAVSLDLIKTLIISWALGFGLSLISPNAVGDLLGVDPHYGYSILSAFSALLFISLATFCYRYLKNCYGDRTNMYLVCLLMSCMVVSAWFNVIFTNPDNYWIFYDIRYGYLFSWKNIYRAVEIFCLIKVGRDGFLICRDWYNCRGRHFSVNIGNIFNILTARK